MPGQLDLFKSKKQRGTTKAPSPKEFAVHCALADTIRRWINPGWIWTHFPAGEERPAEFVNGKRVSFAGARLKRMGLAEGWPDFIFFHVAGQVDFLELKRRGQKPDSIQDAIGAHFTAAGHGYIWTDSFDVAVAHLVARGILRSVKVQ